MKEVHRAALRQLDEYFMVLKADRLDLDDNGFAWSVIRKRLLDQEKLIDVALTMRTAQKEFFDTRSKQALFQSKDLERKCDLLLGELVLNNPQGRLL